MIRSVELMYTKHTKNAVFIILARLEKLYYLCTCGNITTDNWLESL